MENPSTWDATHRLINESLWLDHSNPGRGVVDALKNNNLLMKVIPDLEVIINDEVKRVEEMFADGFCGRSISGIVYDKLIAIGAV